MPAVLIKGSRGRLYHHCPACKRLHQLVVKPEQWDNDMESPTMSPVFTFVDGKRGVTCRYYISGGRLHFVEGTTHDMRYAGVEMKELPQIAVV